MLSRDVVIVEAVRSPLGRRGGGLSTMHPADLLGSVQRALLERAGVDPAAVGQVVGGCVTGRRAVVQHRPHRVADRRPADVGGGHHRRLAMRFVPAGHRTWPPALIASGVVDVALACGVESMSRDPARARHQGTARAGPSPRRTSASYEFTTQFEGAERIAEKWGITREDTRRVRAREPAPGRRGPGPRAASTARSLPIDAPDPRRGRQARRRHASRRARTRGSGRRRSRRWPALKPVAPGGRRATPPAPRRRSPTARRPCC